MLKNDPALLEIPARTTDEPRYLLDRAFDNGKDITGSPELSRQRRPELEQKRVNVDFPVWIIHKLDREARRLGVTRQSVIKMWLADRLKEAA